MSKKYTNRDIKSMVRKIDKIKDKAVLRKIYNIIKKQISSEKLITRCNDGIFIIFNGQDNAMYAEIDIVLKKYENMPHVDTNNPEQQSYKPYVDSDEDLGKLSIKERILLRRNDVPPEKCITFGS